MTHQETLFQAFATALNIELASVQADLTYNTIPEWDSTAHMILVAEIEDAFAVMLDTDDIIDMSSVAKAMEILAKYEVTF